jgi:diamine N-acetyltransferase
MSVGVRLASRSDYEQLLPIYADVDELHLRNLSQVFQKPEESLRSEEYFDRILDSADAAIFVAVHSEDIVGFISVCSKDAPDHPAMVPRKYAEIDTMAVMEQWRDRGIGRLLLAQARDWAVSRGAAQIELNVWEFNSGAIEFYERCGYTTTSRKMWVSVT